MSSARSRGPFVTPCALEEVAGASRGRFCPCTESATASRCGIGFVVPETDVFITDEVVAPADLPTEAAMMRRDASIEAECAMWV